MEGNREGYRVVRGIKEGVVADHLPVRSGRRVLDVLEKIAEERGFELGRRVLLECTDSRKYGRKDIIKVEGLKYLPKEVEITIALLRPEDPPTINKIENWKVVEKYKPQLPERFSTNFLRCPHPDCITNSEGEQKHFGPHVQREFEITRYNGKFLIRCLYCNTLFSPKEIPDLIG